MALGPHIRPGEVCGAEIADVPATVLALLGCPIPADFDGRALTEMFTDDVPPPERMDEWIYRQKDTTGTPPYGMYRTTTGDSITLDSGE